MKRKAAAPQLAAASTRGLEALVAGLFDYAGMFPPASLELDAALWESARSPRLARPHMVGADLVVGLDDLARLDEERLRMAGFGDTEAKVAVVGVEPERLQEAVAGCAHAAVELAGVIRVVSLEVHGTTFPSQPLVDAAHALPGVQVYLEPRMPDNAWARNAPGVLRLLQRLRLAGATVGLKVRGSGATAVSAETLGWLVPQVVAQRVPLKATAGLHHPVVEDRYGDPLGFLGLAAALRLRQALGDAVTAEMAAACVAERDAGAFSLDDGVAWRGHALGLDDLRAAMAEQPFAIGSCSLREPDEDLVRLFGPPR